MGQIQFQNEAMTRRTPTKASTGFARRLISWGVVKTEKQANVMLLLLILIAGAITGYNLFHLTATPLPPILNEQATPN